MNTEETSQTMPSIRNVVTRLAPVQILTKRLPKFSESLVRASSSEHLSQSTPSSVPWPKYAAGSQNTSIMNLLKSRPAAKVIAIGEHHHQKSILNLQMQVLEAASSQHPDETVLVTEYFNLAQARLLKSFNNQQIDVSQLAAAYNESNENFDVEGHLAPLLLLAREKGVPLVGGFPPREWARDFLNDNVGILSKLKHDFAFDRSEDTKSQDGHDAYFESLLSGEAPRETVPPGEARKGARIFPAQLLKDAVMAWSIDQQLAKGKRVVALAGLGHLEYGFGVMERVREAKREDIILIACKSSNESELWLHKEEAGAGAGKPDVAGLPIRDHETAVTKNDRPIADAVYLYDAE